MKLERPLVALDLETTGPNHKRDRIVQIGVVKLFPDGHEKEWETLVNPGMPIPPEATKIHGITDAIVKNECSFEIIAPGFKQACLGSDICGYNVQFDIRFLKTEYGRLGKTFEHGFVIDGYKIFIGHEKRTLSAAVEYYLDESLEGAHTALVDARASLRILQAQLKRYPDLPQDVEGLHHFLFNTIPDGFLDSEKKLSLRSGKPCLNFGKFAGIPLHEVDHHYLEWILKSEFSDEVKIIVGKVLREKM